VDDLIALIGRSIPGFDIAGRVLMVDKNQSFHRIMLDDKANRYYGGRLGEIYRIIDGSSVRYRIVTMPLSQPAVEKKKLIEVTGKEYAMAYENIITMLIDRLATAHGAVPGSTAVTSADDVAQFSIPRATMMKYFAGGSIRDLTIPDLEGTVQLTNSRGQAMYVFFLDPQDDILVKRKVKALYAELVGYMNRVIEHHRKVTGEQLSPITVDDFDHAYKGSIAQFAAKFELILIYNDPTESPVINTGIDSRFYQTFSVQQMSFLVSKHIDQPHFTLLHPDRDKEEIRNIYAQNGRPLDPNDTLADYSLRDGVRLVLI